MIRLTLGQKIERLKGQLTALADLLTVHDTEGNDTGLDEEELEILAEAGIIAGPSERRSSRPPAKHIVFVENEEEGMHGQFADSYTFLTSCSTTVRSELWQYYDIPLRRRRHPWDGWPRLENARNTKKRKEKRRCR
jgi:hypothetical protein